jgi:carboxypeptidase Q
MVVRRLVNCALLVPLVLVGPLRGQERPDTGTIGRIREEGFHRSRVLETALGLSDLSPPRLAGSPGYLAAATWAVERLRGWGIADARLEPWGRRTPGWVLDRYSAEMVAPWYLRLTAFPRAWSPPTAGPVEGPIVVVRLDGDSDLARVRGMLRGRIVLNGTIEPPERDSTPPFRRLTKHDLDSLEALTTIGEPADWAADVEPWRAMIRWRRRLSAFLAREGALALVEPSGTSAALRADGWFDYPDSTWGGVPSFVVQRAQFDRMLRLAEAGRTVRLALDLGCHTMTGDSLGYDVVAELPGSDPRLRDQVVMLGGHLDSWIAGTGATDNAAGSAVAMEAMRILQRLGLRPRRTIRMALWDAEEPSEDYAGSSGYVRRHFGEPTTGTTTPEQPSVSAYFNLDNGTGRIRGIYLQGDAAARPVFRAVLAPLADLDADHVTLAATGETDHIPFWAVGIPAFEFIQDPVDYETVTHHTDLDTGDYLLEEDLRQAAVVLATVVYGVAMRDDPIPRPTPATAPATAR